MLDAAPGAARSDLMPSESRWGAPRDDLYPEKLEASRKNFSVGLTAVERAVSMRRGRGRRRGGSTA